MNSHVQLYQVCVIFVIIFADMNQSELVYTGFTMDRLEQATKMAVDAFEVNNVFSKEGVQTKEETSFRTSVSIQLFHNAMQKYNHTNHQFIKMILYRNKMIGMVMASELHLFIDDMLPLFDPQQPYAQVFKIFNKSQYPKNTTLLASLLVVHKDFMKYNISNFIIRKSIEQVIGKQFKNIVGGSTNPISLKLSKKIGGKLLEEIQLSRNGKIAPIYLIGIQTANLSKILPKL